MNKRIVEYRLLKIFPAENTIEALTQSSCPVVDYVINKFIKDGWQPYGSAVSTSDGDSYYMEANIYQPMVRYEEVE